MPQVMIFCRTNLDCINLQRFFQSQSNGKLLHEKYTSATMAGLMSMEDRRRSLQQFKDGEIRILICTDVAARGIDIDSLPYVINITLPDEPQNYIHRIGRVGRADRMGLAISIVSSDVKEKVWYHSCKGHGRGVQVCYNRKLKKEGGCTIWYDEGQLIAAIEKKLQGPILALDSDTLDLPKELKGLNVTYGESSATEVVQSEQKVYMTERRLGTVRTLTALETQAQDLFLSLQLLGNNNNDNNNSNDDDDSMMIA
eukprot:gene6232-6871_t